MVAAILQFNYEAARIAREITRDLRRIRYDIMDMMERYCRLRLLEATDTIRITDYLDEETIELIEKLADLQQLKCEIPF